MGEAKNIYFTCLNFLLELKKPVTDSPFGSSFIDRKTFLRTKTKKP